MSARVLVLDDDNQVLNAVARVLGRAGHDVSRYADPAAARAQLVGDAGLQIALLDLNLPGVSGLDLLREAKATRPELIVIMMTASSSIQSAMDAVRAGAFDYLTKPFEAIDTVLLTVERAATHLALVEQNRELVRRLEARESFEDLVGQSPKMRSVFELIDAVGPTPATVLIRGQSGTGKELVARAVHRRSDRAQRAFCAVNCSALSESMLEAELFGHVKGAFTGALADRKGLFEAADRGTLFLDEIGDISPRVQVALLRALQEGEVKPVGANASLKVDVRLIAATNLDLEAAIKEKRFREDLFYRLNVITIALPPLADRPEDILLLAHHFLKKHAGRMKKSPIGFSDGAAKALATHPWPGNIRELENAVARALVLCKDGAPIEVQHLPPGLGGAIPVMDVESTGASHLPYAEAKKSAMATFDRSYLTAVMRRNNGNITHAARDAGMDRSNFKRVLRDAALLGPSTSAEGDAEA